MIENEVTPLADSDILNSDELERAIKQAKPIKKDAISILINEVELDLIEALIEQTKELLGRKVASKVIDELRENVDIANWVETGLPGKENDIVRERIYKFVNVYSHDKKINVFEELDTDILDGNSQMVINDILDMIQKLDQVHYDSMVDKIKNEL